MPESPARLHTPGCSGYPPIEFVMDATETPSPRLDGFDQTAIAARLDACAEHFLVHVDELDYRNFEPYVTRASFRFVAGSPIIDVVDDLFLAARCLHERSDLHLSRLPNERFLSRRVIPVELAIISGQPVVIQEMAEHYGLPLILLLAQSAPDQIFKEAILLTSFFRRGSCTVHQDLAGLGAIVYAGAIAAIARGFDDEAVLALNLYADARGAFDGLDPGPAGPVLKRYDRLNLALACLLRGEWDELAHHLADLAETYIVDLKAKLGEAFTAPESPQRYIDLSVITLLALAALRQVALPLPEEGIIARYQEFVVSFTTSAPRELEQATLSIEDRQLLRQVGMDPDAVESDLRAQAEMQQEAISEASAAATAIMMRQGITIAPPADDKPDSPDAESNDPKDSEDTP